jgi:hypothetical protein
LYKIVLFIIFIVLNSCSGLDEYKNIAENFIKAAKEHNLDYMMSISDVPYYWDGKEIVISNTDLKEKWSKVFQEKNLQTLKILEIKRLSLNEINKYFPNVNSRDFNYTDRHACLKMTIFWQKERNMFLFLINDRNNHLKVVGFKD